MKKFPVNKRQIQVVETSLRHGRIFQTILYCIAFACFGTMSCQAKQKTEAPEANQEITAAEDQPSSMIDIPCFVYHRFGDNRYPSTNVTVPEFRSHLQYLKNEGYRVLTLGEAVKIISRQEPVSGKMACITVDDGYKSFLQGAMPLLREFGYKATLFVNTETVGAGDYLSWADLQKLMQEGIELGNHSHAHPYFLNTPEQERKAVFVSDVQKAQDLFEEHLGIQPEIFAYPYGEFDQIMEESLRSMGFIAAAAQNSGVLCESSNIYGIPRFPMAGSYASQQDFAEKVKMRAMRLNYKGPVKHLPGETNPPVLILKTNEEQLNISELQLFVQGGKGEIKSTGDGYIEIRALAPLQRRRTLYTLTARAKEGGHWLWFSHLWVRPEIKE
ncbi:MAG: polysaccharide deacetylase family protein [Cyclobacteriaceae bacterium]|nr:polysaccharide deacetylase family protein [Cyclobacteriaceae bacterium]